VRIHEVDTGERADDLDVAAQVERAERMMGVRRAVGAQGQSAHTEDTIP
jgi:hypothetical protein